MIKTRLLGLVTDSKKYIFANVILQWIGMICSVVMILVIAGLLDGLRSGAEASSAVAAGSLIPELSSSATAGILILVVVLRILCLKLASTASYYASADVKRTMRGLIYEKLLRIGSTYRQQVSTAEVVQLAGEGVEQLETYFGDYLPQFFYAMLAPVTLFAVVSRISLKVAVTLLVCVPLIPVSIAAVQKIAKRLLNKYWGQYATLGDNFLENLQGLTTLKVYRADEQRHREMNAQAEHFREITMKVLSMQLNSIIIMDIIAYGGSALGILLAVQEMSAGSVGFYGCFAIILLSADFFLPMRRLGSYFHVAMNGMAASDKIFRVLWDLLEKVKLADFIRSEGGLDLPLREGASNLSGGQRQRLALARALLYDPPIFIFDEATSNIDVESENDIIRLIHGLAKTKTVLLISHRLANAVQADRIYVLEGGSVVQSGSHEELAAQAGLYRRLWEGQRELESITGSGKGSGNWNLSQRRCQNEKK